MTVVGVIQARMGSSRLPGKVMLPLGGEPVLTHDIRSLEAARSVDTTVVATSTSPENDVIERHAHREGVRCYRGSESDVIGRVLEAARDAGGDSLVRRSADHPLVSAAMTDAAIEQLSSGGFELVTNRIERTFPRGVAVEAYTLPAFETLDRLAGADERENVSSTYRSNLDAFRHHDLTAAAVFDDDLRQAAGDLTRYRVVLDEPDDYERLWQVFSALGDGTTPDLEAVIRYLADNHPLVLDPDVN